MPEPKSRQVLAQVPAQTATYGVPARPPRGRGRPGESLPVSLLVAKPLSPVRRAASVRLSLPYLRGCIIGTWQGCSVESFP